MDSDLKYTQQCVFVDVLTDDVWVEEVVKILVEVFDIKVWRDAVIDTSSGVRVEVLVGVKAGDLVPAMTSL